MKLFEQALEAFAVGDAMGMPTEFMEKEEIKSKFGFVDKLLDTKFSKIHKNLRKGQITDDTEQNIFLIRSYYENGKVDIGSTIRGLRMWIDETHPDEKGYIGPSTLKAFEALDEGKDITEVGTKGTTCGAAMRSLAPALCTKKGDISSLKEAILSCSIPTHNTNVALEAAMALGFGYHYAAVGASFDEIIESMVLGAKFGRSTGKGNFVGASTGSRIELVVAKVQEMQKPIEVIDFIYNVIGTTMESNEVVPSAVAIFAYTMENTWLSIKMGASVGGDTDTIAAIAGALSCLYAGSHTLPKRILNKVREVNNIDFRKYAQMALEMFGGE
jgi:ADP-ribosylglycohydrolase